MLEDMWPSRPRKIAPCVLMAGLLLAMGMSPAAPDTERGVGFRLGDAIGAASPANLPVPIGSHRRAYEDLYIDIERGALAGLRIYAPLGASQDGMNGAVQALVMTNALIGLDPASRFGMYTGRQVLATVDRVHIRLIGPSGDINIGFAGLKIAVAKTDPAIPTIDGTLRTGRHGLMIMLRPRDAMAHLPANADEAIRANHLVDQAALAL